MAIESLIEKLIAALEANTAAQGGAKATSTKKTEDAGGDEDGTKTTKGGKGGKAPKHDAEQVKAVAVKLMDVTDRKTAVALIKKHGADQLADLKPEKYDAFVAAAEKLIEEKEGGDGDGDGDGGL